MAIDARQHRHALPAQPVEHGVAVPGVQDFVERVGASRRAHAMGQCQKVQVMVAEHRLRGQSVLHEAAQHGGRLRTAIDQVAQEVERVAAWREGNFIQQALQCAIATLDVANQVK